MIECLRNVAAAMAISVTIAAALALGDPGAAHDPDATHDRTRVALSMTVLEASADGNHAVTPPSGPHTRCG